jgi:hypothetical protein
MLSTNMHDWQASKIENSLVQPLGESPSNTSGCDLPTEAEVNKHQKMLDKDNALLTAIKGDTQEEYWSPVHNVTLSNTLNVCGTITCPSMRC